MDDKSVIRKDKVENPKVSIIVPCYNEEEALPYFMDAIRGVENKLISGSNEFELILVDDGSKDNTLKLMIDASREDIRVKYISFSRNFGKEAAIYAGLRAATGDYVAMLDADLQDPPELITEMLDKLQNSDYDCVATRRVTRQGEPIIRSWFAHKFYQIINKISDADIMDGARDFRLMSRPMVDAVLSMTEHSRFSKGIFGWVGFKTLWLDYENVERVAGQTKWSFWKLFKYAVTGIIDFSPLLLTIPFWLSGLFGVVALVSVVLYFTLKSSLILAILGIVGVQTSLIMLMLGIYGLYIKTIIGDTQNRPIYIIRRTNIHNR